MRKKEKMNLYLIKILKRAMMMSLKMKMEKNSKRKRFQSQLKLIKIPRLLIMKKSNKVVKSQILMQKTMVHLVTLLNTIRMNLILTALRTLMDSCSLTCQKHSQKQEETEYQKGKNCLTRRNIEINSKKIKNLKRSVNLKKFIRKINLL